MRAARSPTICALVGVHQMSTLVGVCWGSTVWSSNEQVWTGHQPCPPDVTGRGQGPVQWGWGRVPGTCTENGLYSEVQCILDNRHIGSSPLTLWTKMTDNFVGGRQKSLLCFNARNRNKFEGGRHWVSLMVVAYRSFLSSVNSFGALLSVYTALTCSNTLSVTDTRRYLIVTESTASLFGILCNFSHHYHIDCWSSIEYQVNRAVNKSDRSPSWFVIFWFWCMWQNSEIRDRFRVVFSHWLYGCKSLWNTTRRCSNLV